MLSQRTSRPTSILQPKNPYFRNKKYLKDTVGQPYTLSKAVDDFSEENDISMKVFLSLIICVLFCGYIGKAFLKTINLKNANIFNEKKEIVEKIESQIFKDRYSTKKRRTNLQHFKKGNIFLKKKQYKLAIIQFDRAKMRHPKRPEPRLKLAEAFTEYCLHEFRYCGNGQDEFKTLYFYLDRLEDVNKAKEMEKRLRYHIWKNQ